MTVEHTSHQQVFAKFHNNFSSTYTANVSGELTISWYSAFNLSLNSQTLPTIITPWDIPKKSKKMHNTCIMNAQVSSDTDCFNLSKGREA